MGGMNQQANGARNGPCVISGACTVIPTSKSVCEDNEGVWWGSGHDDPSVQPNPGPSGYLTCAAINEALYNATPSRSEEHTSELQSLMRISYAVFCLKKKTTR